MNNFKVNDMVQHFKRETLDETEYATNKYLYIIEGFAKHTETDEDMVVYRALYAPYTLYVRPMSLFCSKVDKVKYPDIKQEYRFIVLD